MEEILDQEFNKNEKDETRINRGMAMIRVLVCFGFSYLLSRMLRTKPDASDLFDAVFIIGVPVMMILIIIHNSLRIIQELKQRFIVPIQKKIFILILIIIQSIMMIIFASVCFSAVRLRLKKEYVPIRWFDIIIVLLTLGLFVIIIRETIYYRRAIRLKQLKNQANE